MSDIPEEVGPWLITSLIHRGRNSTVYTAIREGSADVIALKVCNVRRLSEPYQRFQQEVAFLATTHDPGVLPMIEGYAPPLLKANERGWLATPLATPLDRAMAGAALPVIVAALAEIAETLARLAANDQHHRDIKPENLFLLGDRSLVGDFGLVSFPGKPALTADDKALGAFDYMAPEMRTNPPTALAEPADVYGLAKSLWTLATGRLPVPWPNPANLRDLASDARAYRLEPLLMAATGADPSARPSLAEVAEELRAWLHPHEADGSKPDLDLADGLERVAVFTAGLAGEEAKRISRVQAADRVLGDLKEYIGRVNSFITKGVGACSYGSDTQVLRLHPETASGLAVYQTGLSCIKNTGRFGLTLIAFVGVEVRGDGLHHIVGALALEPYEGTGRRLVWLEMRDVLPGSSLEGDAVRVVGEGLVEALPQAVQAWADGLESRREDMGSR